MTNIDVPFFVQSDRQSSRQIWSFGDSHSLIIFPFPHCCCFYEIKPLRGVLAVGHEARDRPWCLDSDGSWSKSPVAHLDLMDRKNWRDGPRPGIDRHDCVALDANGDGLEDITCLVGANKGQGVGFNELYLTQRSGKLEKVLSHGLQKYPTMRTRLAAKLRRKADGSTLIFISTTEGPRDDGKPNQHRMFRLLKSHKPPYFVEVPGPWVYVSEAVSVPRLDSNNTFSRCLFFLLPVAISPYTLRKCWTSMETSATTSSCVTTAGSIFSSRTGMGRSSVCCYRNMETSLGGATYD